MKTILPASALARACVVALAAGASGCAHQPSAARALAAGTASMDAARAAGAPEYASAELERASGKLDRARDLAQQGRQREAIRLAEEAEADAQVARASAGAERSRRAMTEVEASLQMLRDEVARPGPGSPRSQP